MPCQPTSGSTGGVGKWKLKWQLECCQRWALFDCEFELFSHFQTLSQFLKLLGCYFKKLSWKNNSEHNRTDLGALCTAVSAWVVEQRSAQAFSQEFPVVSQLLWTQPCPPATPFQQELQLTLPSGWRERKSELQTNTGGRYSDSKWVTSG